jgi:hypothetical protein
VVHHALETAGLAARVATHVLRERVAPPVRVSTRHDVPPSAEAISPEWLTDAIASGVPGARAERVEITGGSDGTSSRRAVSVTWNGAGADAGLPTRLFVKSAASFFSRMLLGLTDIAEGESVFYNRVRPGLRLRSPRSYFAAFDRRTYRSVVLLEDLGQRGWTFPDPRENKVTYDDARDMVAEMARYHGSLWGSRRFAEDLSTLRHAEAWQHDLDRKVGFRSRTMRGFDRAREVLPARLVDRRDDLYPAFHASLALHRRGPQTLLHQDLHLGNWLRDDAGRMGLYDWQCVARGGWGLDYSYALAGALDPEDREAWQEDLLTGYLLGLHEAGARDVPDLDEAWLTYRQQPLHALAFGLFTLGGTRFEPELQPRDYTLAAIERIARCVDDLGTLDALAAA